MLARPIVNRANAAQTTADTARTEAATAQATANDGVSRANAAQGTANTALANAANAQATADTAAANGAYFRSNSTGPGPQATGANATAIGSGAVAGGASSVAIGTNARAINGMAVSIGAGNTASGNGAVAIGDPNVATGTGAVAMGADNTATGTGSVALGNRNVANGDGAVALGTGSSTYTMAGIASDASRAAQSGGVGFVTADANGNLATTRFGPGDIARLDDVMRRDRRDSRAGIAAAAALGYAPMPSEPGRTSYVVNGTTFRGRQAVGGSLAHRFATDVPLAVTAGFAYGGNKNNLGRVGVAGEF